MVLRTRSPPQVRSPEITPKGFPESIRQVYKFAIGAKYIEFCFQHNAEKWYAKYKSRGGDMGWRSFLYSNSELHRDHPTPASGGSQSSEAQNRAPNVQMP